jgi:hypothetical protein
VQCEISCQILSKDRKAQFLYLCARFRVVWSDSNCPRCAIGPTSSSRNSAKISEDSSTELTREHHTETTRADFGPSQNLYGLTKVIFQHDNILWHHFSTSQRPSVYRSFTWEVWCRTWSRKSFPMLLDRQWVVISTSWKQVP